MKYIEAKTPRSFIISFVSLLLIVAGGLMAAEAGDSKATFTVQ